MTWLVAAPATTLPRFQAHSLAHSHQKPAYSRSWARHNNIVTGSYPADRPCCYSASTSPPGRNGSAEGAHTCRCRQAISRRHQEHQGPGGIRSAAVIFVLGLALEFVATLVAFGQAQSSGALYGDVDDCGSGTLKSLHDSDLIQQHCEQMDEGMVLALAEEYANTYFWPTVGCELENIPTGNDAYRALCRCEDGYDPTGNLGDCYWVSGGGYDDINNGGDLLCVPLLFSYQSSTTDRVLSRSGLPQGSCWPIHAEGTRTMVILTTLIALASQLVEGVVGLAYFKNPDRGPRLKTAASIFEAAGVVVIFALLSEMKMFTASGSDFFWLDSGNASSDQVVLRSLGICAAGFASVGVLIEVYAGCLVAKSNGVPRTHRGHYLSGFAGAAIWLGAALIELVVTTHLVLQGEGMANNDVDDVDWSIFQDALASLVALELLALVVLWVAKYLWARAKLLVQLEDSPRKSGLQ